MKIFKRKGLIKLLVIICLMLTGFTFLPNDACAFDGGKLLSPVCDLLNGIGDGIMRIYRRSIRWS